MRNTALTTLLALAIVPAAFLGCGGNDSSSTPTDTVTTVSVKGISLDKASLYLAINEESALHATLTPDDATNKAVNWSSTDRDIATVDSDGRVKGISKGTALIVANAADGGYSAYATVYVETKVTGVSLDKNTLSLTTQAGSQTLQATITPIEANNKALTWSSSNPGVASVDKDGKVTPLDNGRATITVTTVDGGYTDTCEASVVVNANGVSVAPASLELLVDGRETLIASVLPRNALNQGIIWTSTNPPVVSVEQTGVITAHANGHGTVIASTVDGGFVGTCFVSVVTEPTGITVAPASVTIKTWDTFELVATVLPEDASNMSVTWSSSNTDIVSVDDFGVISGLGAGNAVITATTVIGGYSATCSVTVEPIHFIAGYQSIDSIDTPIATIWRENVPELLSPEDFKESGAVSVFVSKNNSVYATGYGKDTGSTYGGEQLAILWVNSNPIVLTSGDMEAQATEIYVNDQTGDIYVSGWEKNALDKKVSKVWRINSTVPYATDILTDGGKDAEARGIFVPGHEMSYGVGYEYDLFAGFVVPVAKLWYCEYGWGNINVSEYVLNNDDLLDYMGADWLAGESKANAVTTGNGNTYVAGYALVNIGIGVDPGDDVPPTFDGTTSIPRLWVNGQPENLMPWWDGDGPEPEVTRHGEAFSVKVASDGGLFVAGYATNNQGGDVARLWFNGEQRIFTDGSYQSRAHGVAVMGVDDVYTVGFEGGYAMLWRGCIGVANRLANSQGHVESKAYSVFLK